MCIEHLFGIIIASPPSIASSFLAKSALVSTYAITKKRPLGRFCLRSRAGHATDFVFLCESGKIMINYEENMNYLQS